MIKTDIVFFIATMLSSSIVLVFAFWLFYNYNKDENILNKTKYLQQCPYCTHIFFVYEKEDIQTCPQCKSFLKTRSEQNQSE